MRINFPQKTLVALLLASTGATYAADHKTPDIGARQAQIDSILREISPQHN